MELIEALKRIKQECISRKSCEGCVLRDEIKKRCKLAGKIPAVWEMEELV